MAHPTILSLFSGVGGLDLGIKLVCPGARVLGYVERDTYAAAVLLARMEDASLEPAPVWIGDIQDVDGSEFKDRVDIICGGFPCQDISIAWKGIGIGGKRSGLWSEIVRLAREIRPKYIFLENVSIITSRGLDRVISDLAEIGFDAEWLCLRAASVGAPHRRDRWFCLAYSRGIRESNQWVEDWSSVRIESGRHGREVDDSNCTGLQGWTPRGQGGHPWSAGTQFPPRPADHDGWEEVPRPLYPAVEPGLRMLVDGVALVVDESRADQLRCCGNGVVPLQAAAALKELLRRVSED